eukprot:8126103-Pyramimonas_sp.AAC.1
MVPLHATSFCAAKSRTKKNEFRRGRLLSRDLIPTQLTLLSVQGGISLRSWGRGKMATTGSDACKLPRGKGARVLVLMKTPSGHLALKVDECGAAAEDERSMPFLFLISI